MPCSAQRGADLGRDVIWPVAPVVPRLITPAWRLSASATGRASSLAGRADGFWLTMSEGVA
jgi:hypothetical protein